DPRVPLFITDSPLKALALSAAIEPGAYCVVAVSGCWNWRSGDMPLSDHRDIPWQVKEGDRIRHRRGVYFFFDSDAATKSGVALARWEYGAYLDHRRRARVFVVDVPADGAEKQGIDDALAAGHDLETMIASAYRLPEEPPAIA